MKYLSKQTIYINSRNREPGGTDSQFSYKVSFDGSNNYDSVVLMQACIPKTYYLVQAGLNSFTVAETSASVVRTFTVTGTPGNSTRGAFATDIAARLTAQSLAVGFGWTYAMTYPDQFISVDTGKYTFTVAKGAASGTIQAVAFTFDSLVNSLICEPLGFSPSTTYVFTVAGSPVAGTLTSANVAKLQAEDSIAVRSNICSQYNTASTGSGTLQMIFANAGSPAFSNIVFSQFDPEGNSKKLTSNSAGIFDFIITNEDGDIINTNGLNIQLELMVFKLNDTSRLHRGYIKLVTYVLDKWFPKVEEMFTKYIGGESDKPPAIAPYLLEGDQ